VTASPVELPDSAPADAVPAGKPPYWEAGQVVLWQDRPGYWRPGESWGTTPVRVVRDDEHGLVAWLAPGTPRLVPHPPDGRGLRSLPLDERFSCALVAAKVSWRGPGVLFLSPTGKPWSVWLFWSEDGVFAGWYVNLELPHRRDSTSTWTGDHELDVWIEPDGTTYLKDEDDLEASVAAGRFTPREAEQIHRHADLAKASFERTDWPFAQEWTTWRPDPLWSVPELPPEATWQLDLSVQH
jgi:hypothetical protein